MMAFPNSVLFHDTGHLMVRLNSSEEDLKMSEILDIASESHKFLVLQAKPRSSVYSTFEPA